MKTKEHGASSDASQLHMTSQVAAEQSPNHKLSIWLPAQSAAKHWDEKSIFPRTLVSSLRSKPREVQKYNP